ncbi:MAG TPA: hypothetical protein H9837_02980 [Candidatus Brachybacterium merdigallinarum]|nr:hypothetical protein [Candidatus Brachybacterium merdigallinarum]
MQLSLIPWAVREEHRGTHIYRMLERESLLRAGLPGGTQEELEQLEEWKAGLAQFGAVVDYVPRHRFGFVLVYATESEAEAGELIRWPKN